MKQITKTTLNKLIAMLEEANGHRAKNQKLVDELKMKLRTVIAEFIEVHAQDIQKNEEAIKDTHNQILNIIDPDIRKLEIYINDRTDKWKNESDAGMKAQDWLLELEEFRSDIENDTEYVFDPDVHLDYLDTEPVNQPKQTP